ncbi:hypothetical protein [Brevifollis gellanilyticus]|nr:hypothetical protein [Brevifollis gellanilyticus]
MKRRAARPPDPSPAWGGQQQPSPFSTASPFTRGAPANPWPVAPEASPAFSPPPQTPASFPPPSAFGAWESVTRPPPSPFTSTPSSYVPVTSMFGAAEQPPFQTQPAQTQPAQPAWQPEPVYAPAYQSGPMAMPAQAALPAPAPLDFAAMRESPTIDKASMEAWQPPRKHSYFLPVFFIVLVVGACVWVLRDDLIPPMVVEIPAGKSEPAEVTKTPDTTPQPVIAPKVPEPVPTVPEPEPEIRKAEVPKVSVDLVAASESGQKLFLDLLESSTAEARAKLIDQPEEHSADVEEFFAAGKPRLLSFKPSNATPQLLPGQLIAPLFQVTTRENSHGALLRLVPKEDGTFLLDWPLFAETHQRRLAQFLEKKPADPTWFQVGMRRSHALELSESERNIQISFTLQGSADASVSCLAVCTKDTPIGRYLGRETQWSVVYLARLLLQHRQLADGSAAVVILDCEGAATAETK